MSRALAVADVVEINRKVTGEQVVALLDVGKLDGALSRPFHSFGGALLIPERFGQAGALLEGLVAAHAFSDGNKRTAWISVKTFLRICDRPLRKIAAERVADFVEAVAVHKVAGSDIAATLAEWETGR